MWASVEPKILVRKNQDEGCWEVMVDLGRFGRLFHYKADAEKFAKEMEDPKVLGLNLYDTLKKLE